MKFLTVSVSLAAFEKESVVRPAHCRRPRRRRL